MNGIEDPWKYGLEKFKDFVELGQLLLITGNRGSNKSRIPVAPTLANSKQ
jgi:hypothetical protein